MPRSRAAGRIEPKGAGTNPDTARRNPRPCLGYFCGKESLWQIHHQATSGSDPHLSGQTIILIPPCPLPSKKQNPLSLPSASPSPAISSSKKPKPKSSRRASQRQLPQPAANPRVGSLEPSLTTCLSALRKRRLNWTSTLG